ncbi:ferredoxin [Streptomyces olivochromogenes]|uniref:Ferredoxin n=1 Tax=Streptomyces olivochromogenes TaxID=1963 RepID=A0A250VKZ3_STROL|nr:ferredoxin [Streptomyces olivochromogenes]KUN44127.1 ferredoxin [Streptomyces olivochromogenes]GAX54883.1 ferredoxin [Streptomyces olivochromogenes]
MRISVDQDKCIASGMCVLAVPEVFDQREEDGIVILRTDVPPPELREAAREAAASCPSWAITVTES